MPGVEHDDFGGLHRDLPGLIGRRQMLRLMGGAGLAGLLAACGVGRGGTTTTAAPTGTTLADLVASAGVEIPDETPGPFPANGTNGPNLLTEAGVVRADITSSIGPLSGSAPGVPTAMQLSVVDAGTGSPVAGAAVYLWHCTADGRYSIYEIGDQNYLRGVLAADDAGRVTFDTVFPGCYPGRWPHAHFEVWSSLGEATSGGAAIKTSQLALPQADCEAVYADGRYAGSAANLSRLSLEQDVVFRDGHADQLAAVSGSPEAGYTASLLVGV